MSKAPVKLNWLDRAIEVYNFHCEQLKEDSSWTIAKTALALNRSLGSVGQDIQIASWVKSHEKQLRKCRSQAEAIEFVRLKSREVKYGGL